jgi:hypothetical protein
VLLPMRCHRCPSCRIIDRANVIRTLRYGTDLAGRCAHIVLTTRTGLSWPKIMRAWTSMRRWLLTRAPAHAYACIKEEGRSRGMRHLHLIIANWSYVPQAMISKEWRKLTGSYVVWVRACSGEQACSYVAKYVTKSCRTVRRTITFSRNWPRDEPILSLRILFRSRTIPDWLSIDATTPGGILFVHHCPWCDCFSHADHLLDGERLWLACRSDPSPPAYMERLAESHSEELASARWRSAAPHMARWKPPQCESRVTDSAWPFRPGARCRSASAPPFFLR